MHALLLAALFSPDAAAIPTQNSLLSKICVIKKVDGQYRLVCEDDDEPSEKTDDTDDEDGPIVDPLHEEGPEGTSIQPLPEDLFWFLDGDTGELVACEDVKGTGAYYQELIRIDVEGASSAVLADLDGDRYDDIVIGHDSRTISGRESGGLYVFYWPMATGSYDLSDADEKIGGYYSYGYHVGSDLENLGDTDGDGTDDVRVGFDYSRYGYDLTLTADTGSYFTWSDLSYGASR